MTITLNPPTPYGSSAWDFTWTDSGGAGPWWVYAFGQLIYQGTNETVRVYSVAEPMIEVFDTSGAVPLQRLYPRVMVIQWYGNGSFAYAIQQWNGSAFETIPGYANIVDYGGGYFTYISPYLPDATVQQFQVLGLDSNLNPSSSPLLLTNLIVGIPDAPDVAITYAGGNVVVSAA